jgi:hypothetical protein
VKSIGQHGVYRKDSITRSIAGCFRFFTLISNASTGQPDRAGPGFKAHVAGDTEEIRADLLERGTAERGVPGVVDRSLWLMRT